MNTIMHKEENEFIKRRRRRKKIKNSLLLFVFLISIGVTLCFKLPYFNITNIKVVGNKNIVTKEIVANSKVYTGNNIFYVNLTKSKEAVLSNPYIESVDFTRKLPNTIQISVKEREAAFYGEKNKKYYIIDKNGVLIQKRNDLNNIKLPKLDGIDFEKGEVGKALENNDKRKLEALKLFASIVEANKSVFNFNSIDLGNLVDIKLYYGEMCVKLGNEQYINEKLNKAINILQRNDVKGAKGYIDVSFEGNPVFFIQK